METQNNKIELVWLTIVMGGCCWLAIETMLRLSTLNDSLTVILK